MHASGLMVRAANRMSSDDSASVRTSGVLDLIEELDEQGVHSTRPQPTVGGSSGAQPNAGAAEPGVVAVTQVVYDGTVLRVAVYNAGLQQSMLDTKKT